MLSKENKLLLPFKQKELIGKDVYFENGIKLGEVLSIKEVYDGNLKNYMIEIFGDEIFSIPIEQIEMRDGVLIYQPIWINNISKRVEEIEERLMLLKFEGGIKNLLKEIEDGKFGYEKYLKDIREINEIYNELPIKLKNLKIEKIAIENSASLLYSKKLLKEISRREFSKELKNLKMKIEICDLNIKYCMELIQKLENSPYILKEQEEKKMKYKCPKCGNIILITEEKRPLIVSCSNCGIKGVIKEE